MCGSLSYSLGFIMGEGEWLAVRVAAFACNIYYEDDLDDFTNPIESSFKSLSLSILPTLIKFIPLAS